MPRTALLLGFLGVTTIGLGAGAGGARLEPASAVAAGAALQQGDTITCL
jgi:hypothetical protein